MIDIKFLRENPETVKENIRKKFQDSKLSLVDEVIVLAEWKTFYDRAGGYSRENSRGGNSRGENSRGENSRGENSRV